MTYEFTGSIISAEGEVIYQRVSGTIYLRKSGRLYEWDGTLTIESGEPAEMFSGFMVTDGGRRAELFARRFTLGSNVIEFVGTGAPPFDHP